MGSIQEKAQREQAKDIRCALEDAIKGLEPESPEREAAFKDALDSIANAVPKKEKPQSIWDFSREKVRPVFVQDDAVIIRPVNENDAEFYVSIRTEYSMMYRVLTGMGKHSSDSLLVSDLCQPESFYCIIENPERVPIGYLGIKDTSADIWELAIELDKQYTQHGLGPRSIVLFLNEVSLITGKTKFKAKVEADNIPSQKCFERIGSKLIGLCNGPILKLEEEKELFEENNLNLIDENMNELADRLGVEPRKLLSHVLEYRMTCPL